MTSPPGGRWPAPPATTPGTDSSATGPGPPPGWARLAAPPRPAPSRSLEAAAAELRHRSRHEAVEQGATPPPHPTHYLARLNEHADRLGFEAHAALEDLARIGPWASNRVLQLFALEEETATAYAALLHGTTLPVDSVDTVSWPLLARLATGHLPDPARGGDLPAAEVDALWARLPQAAQVAWEATHWTVPGPPARV